MNERIQPTAPQVLHQTSVETALLSEMTDHALIPVMLLASVLIAVLLALAVTLATG